MTLHSTVNETSNGRGKVRILHDGSPIPTSSLVVGLRFKGTLSSAFFEVSFEKEIVGFSILGRRSGKRVRLRWRKPGLQGIRDFLRNFAFDREDILDLPVITPGPEMRIGACIDQLHVNAHGVCALLHATFHHGGYT